MSRYLDKNLIHKYGIAGPRYTSYPTAVQFHERFSASDYEQALIASNAKGRDLSLYIHIPFCEHVCYYCACNKIITRNHNQASEYLRYLDMDISRQAALLDSSRRVVQLHFGGGTPTFLTPDEIRHILDLLHRHFRFAGQDEGEYSIEIDPRTVDAGYLAALRNMGFNRVSFGVQDIDPDVQRAINRIQPLEDIRRMVQYARGEGYHSISCDLIYGLPLQNRARFSHTIDAVLDLAPDRLALFNYAHLPQLFGAQKQMNEADMPDAGEKLDILDMSITRLTDAGYRFIGLDHFAKPGDSLVKHQENGTLYRNFQGYSTFSDCDLIGFGVSAISMLENHYSQHEKARSRYYQALDAGGLPVLRGVALNHDDHIRQHVITEIMCNLHLDLDAVSEKYAIDARQYFATEWQTLETLAQDGLITLDAQHLRVETLGRLLIRNIAMVFDAYLHTGNKQKFSKTI